MKRTLFWGWVWSFFKHWGLEDCQSTLSLKALWDSLLTSLMMTFNQMKNLAIKSLSSLDCLPLSFSSSSACIKRSLFSLEPMQNHFKWLSELWAPLLPPSLHRMVEAFIDQETSNRTAPGYVPMMIHLLMSLHESSLILLTEGGDAEKLSIPWSCPLAGKFNPGAHRQSRIP